MNLDVVTMESIPDIGSVRMPVPLTSLLGREAELGDLTALIRRKHVRLVTLTGTGGVGKTRLALELAHRIRDLFPNGQFYIRCSVLHHADQVVPAILRLFRSRFAPNADTLTDLADAMADQQVLVVLNSVDRVIEARAEITSMLEHFPGVTALVTSRIPLRVRGEHQYPLQSLALPHEEMTLEQLRRVPSVDLFVERARAVRPSFDLDPQNADDIVGILERLDGLPFAIELAALRTRLFPLRVIRERMEHLLDFLSGAPHDLPPRLRSMRATIGWSYEILSPDEQRVLRALSVFSSPFSFEAACHVLRHPDGEPIPVGQVMEYLAQMVDHSFVVPMVLSIGNAGYRMPETIRAFGREELARAGERDDVLERELHFYWRGLEESVHEIYGPRQSEFVSRLDQHVGNLIQALNAARHDGQRTEMAVRVTTLLEPYWLLRGRVIESAELLEALLAQADELPDRTLADASRALGSLYVDLYQLEDARSRHQCALEMHEAMGDEQGIIESSNNLGVVAMRMGDVEEARTLLERALSARREGNDPQVLAETLSDAGDLAVYEGDYKRAARLYTEAYQIHTDIENPVGIVCDSTNLLTLTLIDGYEGPVDKWYEVGCDQAEAIGDTLGRALLQITYAMLRLKSRHDGDGAVLKEVAESLRTILDSDSRRRMLEALPMVAEACVYLGDDRLAAQVLGTTSPMTGKNNRYVWYRGRRQMEAMERAIRARLGENDFNRFSTLGAYQTVRQTIEAVIELIERVTDAMPDGNAPVEPVTVREIVQLTGRETQVLALVAQGLSDKDIASSLGISPRTAMTHVSNIMAKMKVHSRSAAAEQGIRMGLIEAPREPGGTGW